MDDHTLVNLLVSTGRFTAATAVEFLNGEQAEAFVETVIEGGLTVEHAASYFATTV
jgi:hypothetical protein